MVNIVYEMAVTNNCGLEKLRDLLHKLERVHYLIVVGKTRDIHYVIGSFLTSKPFFGK